MKKLGEGGMGEVWKALDPKLGRHVALKMPKVQKANKLTILDRFEREAKAVAALEHPGICPVYDYGDEGGQVFLAMAFVAGESLAGLTRRYAAWGKPLPTERVADLARRVAAAMEHAHAQGVVHRDLKPANIMVRPNGDPVVMDFGLALCRGAGDARLTAPGDPLGTPAFMSPEQIRGDRNEVGPRSDVYSLGVILYELLTGRLPFLGDGMAAMAKALSDEPDPPSLFRPGLDPRRSRNVGTT